MILRFSKKKKKDLTFRTSQRDEGEKYANWRSLSWFYPWSNRNHPSWDRRVWLGLLLEENLGSVANLVMIYTYVIFVCKNQGNSGKRSSHSSVVICWHPTIPPGIVVTMRAQWPSFLSTPHLHSSLLSGSSFIPLHSVLKAVALHWENSVSCWGACCEDFNIW